MEGQYPGLAAEAARRTKVTEPPLGVNEPSNGNFGGERVGRRAPWSEFGKMAESAFHWAAKVAEEAAGSEYARRCAEQFCEVRAKNLASDKHQIAVKIELRDLYNCADGLNSAQKLAFAQWVGEQAAAAMLEALEAERYEEAL